MCNTKAEGGRCAGHLRKVMAKATAKVQQAESEYKQAAADYRRFPTHRAWSVRTAADAARHAARSKVRELEAEYDSTKGGQEELAKKIANAKGPEKVALRLRASRGRALRNDYNRHDQAKVGT